MAVDCRFSSTWHGFLILSTHQFIWSILFKCLTCFHLISVFTISNGRFACFQWQYSASIFSKGMDYAGPSLLPVYSTHKLCMVKSYLCFHSRLCKAGSRSLVFGFLNCTIILFLWLILRDHTSKIWTIFLSSGFQLVWQCCQTQFCSQWLFTETIFCCGICPLCFSLYSFHKMYNILGCI